ncbi:hypothetical protein [Taklimakanibacter lacteus]|uniref:hypothetical protein n=1 Tax=Taklimakanibacter lacteus TaxID=2268456 RepID=UPI000E67276E
MLGFFKVLGGFLLGLIAGAAIAFALCLAAQEVFNISQMEGAYAMGVVFFWMPVGALVGGIAGAIWTAVRLSRRKA